MGDELHGVLLLLDATELLQQALDQRAAVLQEAGAQRLQPGVQRPRDPWGGGGGRTLKTDETRPLSRVSPWVLCPALFLHAQHCSRLGRKTRLCTLIL